MMTKQCRIFIVAGAFCLITAMLVSCDNSNPTPTSSPASPVTPVTPEPSLNSELRDSPAALQKTVDAVAALHKGGAFPEYLKQKDAVKKEGDFDVNTYFSVLPHISMNPGYVLDWVYRYDGAGGNPVIYAREADRRPYRTFSEYEAAEGDRGGRKAWSNAMQQIRVDGTPEGFFEFVVLRIMGKQFNLYWHSNYDDDMVIADNTTLEKALKTAKGMGEVPPEFEQKARLLNFQPAVAFEGNTALVRVVTFTAWGGFREKSYTIDKDFPHRVIKEESKTILEYRANIVF